MLETWSLRSRLRECISLILLGSTIYVFVYRLVCQCSLHSGRVSSSLRVSVTDNMVLDSAYTPESYSTQERAQKCVTLTYVCYMQTWRFHFHMLYA